MKATLLAVLAGLCWGVGELCTKYALHWRQVGPITAITIRSTVALPVLWLAYLVASVSGTILAVCSCTVLPMFSGIHKRGAGLGPAIAFL